MILSDMQILSSMEIG